MNNTNNLKPKPPRPPNPNYMQTSTIIHSSDVPEATYEDPDALMLAVTDGGQPEVKVKPVPRPRTKIPPAQCDTSKDTDDPGDKTANAVTSQKNENPACYETPQPVRPPPSPLMNKYAARRPTVAGDSEYVNSNNEPTVETPTLNADKIQSRPPPPERPPLPSIYYDRISQKSETSDDDNKQYSRWSVSSMPESPVSPVFSEEGATESADKPAVPPRPGHTPLARSAMYESPPLQKRPPPPRFSPPPPPSVKLGCSTAENLNYVDVLQEDDNEMWKSKLASRKQNFSGSRASHQQTTEDVYVMLRWLTRVSKSDFIAPPLYGLSVEEEVRSFNQTAMNVRKALRLYNLLMMKRGELLREIITELISISDSLDKVQKKTKTMGIAGGTTGAVGGVTAVLGIALAPVTMGTSLIATAVGAGMVASAGGMGAHAAKASKKIGNKLEVEKLVKEYEINIVDLEHCLEYILSAMNELRRHDVARLQRAGVQTEAVKMAQLSQTVFSHNMNHDRRSSGTHTGGMSSERLLQAFAKELDHYFTEKDPQKLKESKKSKFSGRVRLLAENLRDELEHLNCMWELFT